MAWGAAHIRHSVKGAPPHEGVAVLQPAASLVNMIVSVSPPSALHAEYPVPSTQKRRCHQPHTPHAQRPTAERHFRHITNRNARIVQAPAGFYLCIQIPTELSGTGNITFSKVESSVQKCRGTHSPAQSSAFAGDTAATGTLSFLRVSAYNTSKPGSAAVTTRGWPVRAASSRACCRTCSPNSFAVGSFGPDRQDEMLSIASLTLHG